MSEAEEVIVASSSTDDGVSCWDLRTGAENHRFKPCASPPHGLTSVGGKFLASSQLRGSNSKSTSSSGSIFYWSWNKPQVEVRSFPAEPIKPLVSNSQGTYIAGGGVSGDIYLWEVSTGKLLKKWRAHYRGVTCLLFNDDQSLLISGSEDGCVRVWSLFLMFDDARREEAKHLFEYSFHDHTLKVTDIKMGYGRSNAIIVSASEDRTCKVWSLFKGKILRDIVFPTIIDSISLDPAEHVFYAGGRDGKIYIVGLNAQVKTNSNYGLHIIGVLSEHSKAVTCLTSSNDGFLLISGSEDGMVRIWDTRTKNIVRVLRHAKGPINNVLVLRQSHLSNPRASLNSNPLRRHGFNLSPPLEKFANSPDDNAFVKAFIGPSCDSDQLLGSSYVSVQTMEAQIKELQQKGSAAAAQMDAERLRSEQERCVSLIQQSRKLCEEYHKFCVDNILDKDNTQK